MNAIPGRCITDHAWLCVIVQTKASSKHPTFFPTEENMMAAYNSYMNNERWWVNFDWREYDSRI